MRLLEKHVEKVVLGEKTTYRWPVPFQFALALWAFILAAAVHLGWNVIR